MIDELEIRPVVLAGGRGTRMAPRTNFLPKPLLPVKRKPLLGHVLDAVAAAGLRKPVVITDYMAELVECYLEDDEATTIRNLSGTMIEGLFKAFDKESEASHFWCLSSDVLLPASVTQLITKTVDDRDTSYVFASRLSEPAYKSWEYVHENGELVDVNRASGPVPFERAGLVVAFNHVEPLIEQLGRPAQGYPEGHHLHEFQSGWMLALKLLANGPQRVVYTETRDWVWNANSPSDLTQLPDWI